MFRKANPRNLLPLEQKVDPKLIQCLSDALKLLYTAAYEKPYPVTELAYSLVNTPLPGPTKTETNAKNEALSLLKSCCPAFTEEYAQKLLKAHILLGEACYNNNHELMGNALQLLGQTPLTAIQRTHFLEVRLLGYQTDNDFKILGFLGYASKHNQVANVKLLFKHGAFAASKPLLEEKEEKSYDDKPIFFSVATHTTAWLDYRTIHQTKITSSLVSFDKSLALINAYLDAGFDINITYQNQTVLHHAYYANFSGDMKYPVHLLVNKIVELVEFDRISKEKLASFCEALQKAELLKLFPLLVKSYERNCSSPKPIYASEDERQYYCLKSFLFNLIGLCAYEKLRVETDITSFIAPAKKLEKLQEILSDLKKLQSTYCEGGCHAQSQLLAKQLHDKRFDIQQVLSIKRLPLLASFDIRTTAAMEWDTFLKNNQLEIAALNYTFSPALAEMKTP